MGLFIAVSWGGLLLLILHDVVTFDRTDSQNTAARRRLNLQVKYWMRKIWRAPQRAVGSLRPHANRANVASGPKQPEQTLNPPSDVSSAAVTPAGEARKGKWWSKDKRALISSVELETAIAQAVRNTAPECKNFIGVIVYHRKPKVQRDPNWAVRGVKFGKVDRKIVTETLTTIVEQLQRKFRLNDPPA